MKSPVVREFETDETRTIQRLIIDIIFHIHTLISLINVGLRLFFLRKNSRPYAVIPDPTVICNPTFITEKRVYVY